jgi:deoxyribonuclease-4
MLVGGHVSTSGGLVKAHARAVEYGCDAMQIFNQSPRMWRPTMWKPDDIAEFRSLMAEGPIKSVVIHAVYLINPASDDEAVREKSLNSLLHAVRAGDAIGADGVVVHPGSAKAGPVPEAIERISDALRFVLEETEGCRILLEDTAGAGGTIGRSFEELAQLIEEAGGDERLGVCLDCCHLYASGYDIRTIDELGGVVDEFDRVVGLERLRCIHVNDSQAGLGSNRDRHALLPNGELGREGLAAFLSEPRFENLPALLEGGEGQGADLQQVTLAKELREEGLAARGGKRARGGRPAREKAAAKKTAAPKKTAAAKKPASAKKPAAPKKPAAAKKPRGSAGKRSR